MRKEKDSLGTKEVPEHDYYGIHTVRSKENFSISDGLVPIEIIYAIVKLKISCAAANIKLGQLETKKGQAIIHGCERILSGEFDRQFPIEIYQAGSGTSTHMNVNEVIANLAIEELGGKKGDYKQVHPNDDVNMGQSTNNIFQSAIRIAAIDLTDILIKSLKYLANEIQKKENEFKDIFKSGRTHLQDAVPITLGQEFGAYGRSLKKDINRVRKSSETLLELGVGGNAIGTGINTKKEFRSLIINELNILTNKQFFAAENGIEATQFLTDIAGFSSSVKCLCLDIQKIANDLRLLSSGPNTGFAEIILPAVEPGSSIMPGKINPSICEAVNMACLQIIGYDHVISIACGAGQLELNTYMPLIGANMIKSIKMITNCCTILATKCISGIKANKENCEINYNRSAGLAALLNPVLGYDKTAELVKESIEKKKTIQELIIEKKIMTEHEWEEYKSGQRNL